MKMINFFKWSTLVLAICLSFNSSAQTIKNELIDFTHKTDAFLKAYVTKDGYVKYDAIKAKPTTLQALVNKIEQLEFKALSGNDQKAALINAYNILVIKSIVDKYPVKSPMDIDGFFDKRKFMISRSYMTLNELEKEFLYKNHPDPRLHFVLVCGANGCPDIANFAYVPTLLEEQLEKQTRRAINNPEFIQMTERGIELSEIFNWYQKDFVKDGTNLLDWINKYRLTPFNKDIPVTYYEYDWNVNAKMNIRSRPGATRTPKTK